MTTNQHIIDNLEHYLTSSSPEFAFLISGEWGVGKTYFIEDFMENGQHEGIKLIKVSLFGLKEASEINTGIFNQLHPILGSKHARLLGNILKGALSFGNKLDLDSNGTNETTTNIKLDRLDLSEFFLPNKDSNKAGTKKKELALILDDLERTKIPLDEVLGFINALVEISKAKVIIIANEEKILEDDKNNTYKKFKEKLIGKTFEVSHDFNAVLTHFLSGTTLEGNDSQIKYVYANSQIKNLRKFKQAISDFEYLAKTINKEYRENPEFLSNLIRCFFALSIAVKKGELIEPDLRKNKPFRPIDINSNTEKTQDLHKKYFNNNQTYLYDGDTWADMLFKGDLSTLNEKTSRLPWFYEQETPQRPDWLRLWNFRELDDAEFSHLLPQLESELRKPEDCEPRIYLHKIAIAIYFSKNNLTKTSTNEIIKIINDHISKHKESPFWGEIQIERSSFTNGTGYQYLADEDDDFNQIKNSIIKNYNHEFNNRKEQQEKEAIDKAIQSIAEMEPKKLSSVLIEKYPDEPILNKVDTNNFLQSLLTTDNKTMTEVFTILYNRYSENYQINSHPHYYNLKIELAFWSELQKKIGAMHLLEKPLKHHLLKEFEKHTVNRAIRLLSEE